MPNTLLMVNINPILRDSLDNKSMLLTHFYPMSRKKKKPGLYLQQAGNTLTLNPQRFSQ